MHSPTTTSGPTPEPAQVMRQLARARIGVAVAQPLVLEHHRIRVRCARHLRREQLRQGHARDRTRNAGAGCEERIRRTSGHPRGTWNDLDR